MDAGAAGFFDPKSGFDLLERRLPHFDQVGTFAFVTCRLADSLPAVEMKRWRADRTRILHEAGADPHNEAESMSQLPTRDKSLLRWKLFCQWDKSTHESLSTWDKSTYASIDSK
jgi:hypothetical protein